jgi:hypothetical protein
MYEKKGSLPIDPVRDEPETRPSLDPTIHIPLAKEKPLSLVVLSDYFCRSKTDRQK